MTRPRPLPQQINRDHDQRDRQADPDSENALLRVKAKRITKRQAEEPVSAEIDEHGLARLACAAQCAGGNGLDAIKYLEGSSEHEQPRAYGHDDFILRIDVE